MSNPNQTIFFDDFTAPELDRSKWNVEVTGQVVNNEQQAYVDSPDTISVEPGQVDGANGMLVIQPRYCPGFVTPQGERFDFLSGRINTHSKLDFTYGHVAARIRLPAGDGLWPAFWALGSSGAWPECGEIDIMENVGEPDWASVAVHGPGYSGETPLVNKKYFQPGRDVTTWHVYAVDWSAEHLLFSIDDELIYRATRAMAEFYGPWAFDNRKHLILNFALGGVYPLKINGIRNPYKGLAKTTVQQIKDNQARMLVDWVRVTKS